MGRGGDGGMGRGGEGGRGEKIILLVSLSPCLPRPLVSLVPLSLNTIPD
ncbi:hypothetical protein [Tolypothrix sp. VBCCA 56010]